MRVPSLVLAALLFATSAAAGTLTHDLQILKTGPATAIAGTQLVYTVTVKNFGPANAADVVIDDPPPPGILFASNTGACTTPFPCNLGTLASGATATITSTYDIPQAAFSGPVTNTATVSSSTPDSNTANNTSSATTTIEVKTDLEINKTGPAAALPGSEVEYAITVRNNGPSQAQTVIVTDSPSPQLSLISVSGACQDFPCNLGTMIKGHVVVMTARFRVSTASTGSISNTASVNSATFDPVSTNNSSTVSGSTQCGSGTAPSQFIPEPAAGGVATSGRLYWNDTGAGEYNVYLGRSSANGCSTLLGSVTIPSIAYTDLLPGTEYSWKVVASFGDTCPPKESRCVTFRTAPACSLTLTTISPIGGANVTSPVELRWQPLSGAAEYTVFAKSAGSATFRELGRTSSTSLTAPVANGETQWFVSANVAGCGLVESAVATFTVCNPPEVPLARVVGEVTSAKTYAVEWDAVPNATRYEVDEATNPSFTGAVTTSTTNTSVSFSHATTTARAYYYRVRAFAACTTLASDHSPVVRVVIIPLPRTTDPNPSTNVPAGSQEPVVQQVFIAGVPGVSALYNAVTDRPWLAVRPASGVLPPEGITLEVTADPRTLPNGTFTATVIVTITTPATISSNATTTTSKPVSISLVTPVTPVPNKPAPGSDALIIPSVGHLDGVNSHWQSDIRVTNAGAQPAKYALTFTQAGSAPKQTTITVGAGETTALDDIVRNWFGIGSLGDSANGMLEIRAADNVPFAAVASSRTYNVTANGTLGQFIPAIPFSTFIGRTSSGLSMQQIAQSSLFRTNVGIVEASGSPASVLLSVFNATGTNLRNIPIDLGANEQRQLNSILAVNNISLSDGRIEVKVAGGDGRVTAYASVVDNQTNDPLLVSGVPTNAAGSTKYVLPGVADLTNALASWRTDMRVFNPSFASQSATLTLHRLGGGAPLNASITLQPSEVRALDDVVKSLFGSTNVGGAVHLSTSSPTSLVVTGRTYNQTGSGTYGQFIEAVTPEKAVGLGGRTLHVLQVEDSTRYRTNLGIAEVAGRDVVVEVQIVLPDSKVTPTITFPLAPNEFRQLSVIRDQNLGNVYNARLAIRVVDGQGRIAAYGSVIDMVTQDPTYVPAQ